MTDSAKLCPNCKNGHLQKRSMPQYLNIEGVPEFKVENFQVSVCDSCETEIMSLSDSRELDKLFLDKMIQFYSKKIWEVPGKAASWMRKVIGITARDLAALVRVDESTLSYTFKKNTLLDRTAATMLLVKSRDFLNGSKDGDEIIKKLNDPDSFFQAQIPVDDIILQINKITKFTRIEKSGTRTKSREPRRSRGADPRPTKKDTPLEIFNHQLYSRYTAKLTKQKR